MLKWLFWLSVLLSLYSYAVYPFLLKLKSLLTVNKRLNPLPYTPKPKVTLIVTAYNEESRIEQKIANCLELTYDGPELEIIIASDCSDDETDNLVQTFSHKGVKLVRAQERLGKENAQLAAITVSTGEILVFSDVATEIPKDAINHLVAYFDDPSIGSISSEDRFISKDGSPAGEGIYVKYEMWLRRLESMQEGLIGLSGSFFAVRKSVVCTSWDIYSPSDFNTALNTAKAGLRAVSAPDVLGYYQDLQDPAKEYNRKVRTVIRGMTGLWRHAEVLNFNKMGFFSFQVLSHKLMRWLTPWFLLCTLMSNALIANTGFIYLMVFILQLSFYFCAIIAHFLPELRSISIIKIIYYFVQANIALLDAGIKFCAGRRMTTWKPSAR